MMGVFIDGPLQGEVRPVDGPTWRHALPKRVTVCDCDPGLSVEIEDGPDIVVYEAVTHGPNVAIMSLAGQGDDAILRALRSWTVSDLRNDRVWYRHCRDRRAFL